MAKLIINEENKKSHIEPEIYGHFSEHLGRCIYEGIYVGEKSEIPNVNGMRTDVVDALKELKVPVLRWPGGCFADEYHWMDGIGPKEKRKKMINTHWGGVVEDNSFGTHEYMELCRQIGCKTYVNGNLGSGTVREMSEWVEYMTFEGVSPMADLRKENGHEAPWKVDYFGVGNENWGCGGNMTPEYYANEYRRYQTYVSESAFYVYQIKGSWNDAVTQIAKFGLADGKMDADGAVSVNGRITDTFAINEQNGKLRVLTTSQDSVNGEETNNLYLFEKNLSLTGKIEGIAQGEEIYAARYLGNMAYFVTYRNTDPLFAVDLSDDKNPKVLGELKISGFSEYLHFWGEDKLVGIGYETDEKTGEHTGIKITMFDISDSSSLKEMNSLVLKDYNYSEALYNYKCVLADAEENLLGFALQSYGDEESAAYLLLSWNGEKFETLLSQNLTDQAGKQDASKGADTSAYRGIYVGDMFYIVSTETITSYDRTQEYCVKKSISFK